MLSPIRFVLTLCGAVVMLAPAPAYETVELRVVSYNIHGLQSLIAGDAPKERIPKISRRLNAYDLAFVQEDFNYPALLREHLEHGVVVRGDPLRDTWPGGLFLFNGSGLTIAARANHADRLATTDRYLGGCNGWLGAKFDCWASKGFLRVRLRLPNGVEIDAYDLHLDAGRADADRSVRATQLERLAEAMRELSAGRTVVMAGDFNLSTRRVADTEALDAFAGALALTRIDVSVEDPAGSGYVDHILYRAGAGVHIDVLERGIAKDFEPDDVPLSDHPAVFARLRFRREGR